MLRYLIFLTAMIHLLLQSDFSIADEKKTEAIQFFERRVRPVLVEHCYECHSATSKIIQGGLRLDSSQGMLSGGDSGAVVTPQDPQSSLILDSLRYEGLEMPPKGQLSEQVINDFQKWILDGAIDPRLDNETPNDKSQWDLAEERKKWQYQPPLKHRLADQSSDNWSRTSIDGFILSQLEQNGLSPNPPASKRDFARRLAYDLTGLPIEEHLLSRFEADEKPNSKTRLVDALLNTPQHAEHWTRFWLDISRYAEDQAHQVGNNDSLNYPNAYLYRDWILDAFASDMSYQEFVRLQLAADLVAPNESQHQAALGFIGLGPKYYRRNSPEVMADEWEDRVDTVTRGLLGLTVACARCHDHKYDPISTEDYYALAGIFASTDMFNQPLNESVEKNGDQSKQPGDGLHIVREGKPRDLAVMIRGDVNNQGQVVPRRFLEVLTTKNKRYTKGSGRAELAESIIREQNPLTARVIVNRVWGQFFGRHLIDTPSNFGNLGSKPSHPELLDTLAVDFMDHNWSLKWLQREIALSAAYGQSSDREELKVTKDPENRLMWHMPQRRLTVEQMRDTMLVAADRLNPVVKGKSIQPDDPTSNRRTLYSKISRMDLNRMLANFDFPDPSSHSAQRFETTTPLQKLFLLNSPFAIAQANAIATRVKNISGSDESRIRELYRLVLGRPPSTEEIDAGYGFLENEMDQKWQAYSHALLISNEMFILD